MSSVRNGAISQTLAEQVSQAFAIVSSIPQRGQDNVLRFESVQRARGNPFGIIPWPEIPWFRTLSLSSALQCLQSQP